MEIPDRMEALYAVMKSRVPAPAAREPSGLGGSGFLVMASVEVTVLVARDSVAMVTTVNVNACEVT